jgi:hypothetical protein
MSRARIGYTLAFFGILITTGGCAGSATAPEAATARGSVVSAKRDKTPTDSTVVAPSAGDGMYTTSSGHIAGGGRAEEP